MSRNLKIALAFKIWKGKRERERFYNMTSCHLHKTYMTRLRKFLWAVTDRCIQETITAFKLTHYLVHYVPLDNWNDCFVLSFSTSCPLPYLFYASTVFGRVNAVKCGRQFVNAVAPFHIYWFGITGWISPNVDLDIPLNEAFSTHMRATEPGHRW